MVDSCAGTAGEGLPSTYRAGSSSHEGGVKMRASVAITLAVCSGATLAATGQPSASERLDAVAAELDARESELEARKFWGEPDSAQAERSEEHTSELQSLSRISYAVFCLKKKK